MDCSGESLRIDMGVIVVNTGDTTSSVNDLEKNSDYCSLCLSLEEKIKTIECTCSGLRQGIEQERSEFKLLEDKLEVLKRRNLELEEKIRRIENKEENEEEDSVLQLMIENSVLECEKRKAESDVEYWKTKCNQLQLTVAELENKLVLEAGDRILTKVQGLQGECNNLAQKMYPQEVYTIAKVDEIQSKAGLHANPFFADGEIRSLQSQGSGKSFAKTPSVQAKLVGVNKALLSGNGNNCVSQVRKRLIFEEERGSNKRIAPSTPAAVKPAKVIVIDVTESDDERTTGPPYSTSIIGSDHVSSVPLGTPPIPGIAHSVPFCGSGNTFSNIELPSENDLKMTGIEQVEDSDMVCHNEGALYVPTSKRRRASNIISSDSDTDDDDKVPISMLKTRHFHDKSSNDHPGGHCTQTGDSEDEVRKLSSRRRLVKLSQFEGKSGSGNDIEEVSDSEGESLGGFIVSSSDISDDDISNSEGALKSNSSVAEDSITDSEHISENDSDYGEIISRIRRNKSDKLEWEFEGDMLAAFGKDPELCMQAVCVLYRQQTSEEQCTKETIVYNQRGFSQCDAFRGSTLAEFLNDGDPQGHVVKSVKELQEYDPRGIEVCTTLATRYSKQLFSIYKNKEDPFFSAP